MKTEKKIENIFQNSICDKAKEKLEQAEESRRRLYEQSQIRCKKNEKIRACLMEGICSECGGELRYRCSFNPEDWLALIATMSGSTIHICICKSCGAKKKLAY
jgi:hypothetical protein